MRLWRLGVYARHRLTQDVVALLRSELPRQFRDEGEEVADEADVCDPEDRGVLMAGGAAMFAELRPVRPAHPCQMPSSVKRLPIASARSSSVRPGSGNGTSHR